MQQTPVYARNFGCRCRITSNLTTNNRLGRVRVGPERGGVYHLDFNGWWLLQVMSQTITPFACLVIIVEIKCVFF